MQILDDPAQADPDADDPWCLLVGEATRPQAEELLERVGATPHHAVAGSRAASGDPGQGGPAEELASSVHPGVRELQRGGIAVQAFSSTRDAAPVAWRLVGVGAGVVVLGEAAEVADLRALLESQPSTAEGRAGALANLLLAVARLSALRLDQLSLDALEAPTVSHGFNRGSQRSGIRELRGRLFVLQQLFAAQAQLLDDGELADIASGEEDSVVLKRARSAFAYSRGTCARFYALGGDVLTEESARVNERLTLVSTVFLPATVTTGFFGMNFTWLTDHVESPLMFVLLGVLVPALVSLLVLWGVRRLGAGAS